MSFSDVKEKKKQAKKDHILLKKPQLHNVLLCLSKQKLSGKSIWIIKQKTILAARVITLHYNNLFNESDSLNTFILMTDKLLFYLHLNALQKTIN